MQTRNLPTIDAGYWAAIVAASMCGANSGDLAAGPLGLGHVKGLLPLVVIFFVVLAAEKTIKWTTVAYYWIAVIVLRTMATNIADFSTHDMKLSYPVFEALVAIFMAVMIWLEYRSGNEASGSVDADGVWRSLPATNWNYWITMLAAGTLGTAFGDWIAEPKELGFGVYWGSALCIPIFIGVLWLAMTVGKLTKPWYWLAIVACRTLGTDLGDLQATVIRIYTQNRASSLWVSTIISTVLLASLIMFWRHKRTATQLQPAQ